MTEPGLACGKPAWQIIEESALTRSEKAVLRAMLSICYPPPGEPPGPSPKVWPVQEQLTAVAGVSLRMVRRLINGYSGKPGFLQRGILTKLAGHKHGRKQPPIYQLNLLALPDNGAVTGFREREAQQILPGIYRPPAPGEPILPVEKRADTVTGHHDRSLFQDEQGVSGHHDRSLFQNGPGDVVIALAPHAAEIVAAARLEAVAAPVFPPADFEKESGHRDRSLPGIVTSDRSPWPVTPAERAVTVTGHSAHDSAQVLENSGTSGATAEKVTGHELRPSDCNFLLLSSSANPMAEEEEEEEESVAPKSCKAPRARSEAEALIDGLAELGLDLGDKGAKAIIEEARKAVPDLSTEELVALVLDKAQEILLRPNIRPNPVGLLITSITDVCQTATVAARRRAAAKAKPQAPEAPPMCRCEQCGRDYPPGQGHWGKCPECWATSESQRAPPQGPAARVRAAIAGGKAP